MKRPLQLLVGLIALGALALMCVELAKLMDVGTCASGGPYVSAHQCPDGTGSRILLLTLAILVYTVAILVSGQGMFFYGLLFVALSAMFIRGAATDDGFAAVGYGVGGLFAVMGFVPMVMAILAKLQQLGDLHQRGILTDGEFAAEKAKLLSG
jgi:Short C-terminal domain